MILRFEDGISPRSGFEEPNPWGSGIVSLGYDGRPFRGAGATQGFRAKFEKLRQGRYQRPAYGKRFLTSASAGI